MGMNNYPIPYPNRVHVKFKYRSVSGQDVDGDQIGLKGETKAQACKRLRESFRCSTTPLVEVDGEPVDISEFLRKQLDEAGYILMDPFSYYLTQYRPRKKMWDEAIKELTRRSESV